MAGIFARRGTLDPPVYGRSSATCRSAREASPSSSLANSSRTVRVEGDAWAAEARSRIAVLRSVSAAISHAFVRAISFSKAYRAAPQLGHWLGIDFVSAVYPQT